MANNKIAYGLAKEYGIDTKGMSPKEVWEALKEKGVSNEQASYRQNTSYDEISGKDVKEMPKVDKTAEKTSSNKTEDQDPTPEEIKKLGDQLQRGEYLEIEALKKHPVVKYLARKSDEVNKKYGDTSLLPGREKKREQWKNEFLSMGSMQEQPDGRYKANGPIKREFKAVIVTGLPAAGKSSRMVNPISRDIGGFVFDNDEIKGLIDEFKESKGAAAGAVHEESSNIQKEALKEFLTGGKRQGDNLVIPKIGDDAGKLQSKLIDKLEEAGYDVEIQYNPASLKDSMNRVVMRAIRTGRFIPLDIVEGYGDGPAKAYNEFKNKKNKKGNPYIKERK